jgi:hypothetical protein
MQSLDEWPDNADTNERRHTYCQASFELSEIGFCRSVGQINLLNHIGNRLRVLGRKPAFSQRLDQPVRVRKRCHGDRAPEF